MHKIFITRLKMAANEDFLTYLMTCLWFMLIDGGILDGDQVLNQQIESIATEIASKEEILAGFQCNECDKWKILTFVDPVILIII